MAYRKIHDDFWTDPDMEELTPEQKYFYLYLITNPNVNQIGLYELSIRRACFETGYNSDTVYKLLEYFENAGKIKRSSKTREILVVKFYHHNKSSSPKLKAHVLSLLDGVKDRSLIQYIYSMDTASQEEEEEEEEEEKNKKKKKVSEKPVQIPFPKTVEQVVKIGNMKTVPPEQCENYFHLRSTDNFMRMDKNGNWKPILNWHSDLYHLYRKGALEKQKNYKNDRDSEVQPDLDGIAKQVEQWHEGQELRDSESE